MKTGLTIEELEKIKPPYFIKGYTPKSPDLMYLNYNELGIDEEGAVYVDPALQMNPLVTLSSKFDKQAAENNPFYYFAKLREPWPKSQEWHKLADAKHVDKIKVFDENKHFQQAIMRVFGDR